MNSLAYGIKEAASAAGIGRSTLYKAIRLGTLRATKLGRRTLIRDDDLRSFLERLPSINSSGAE